MRYFSFKYFETSVTDYSLLIFRREHELVKITAIKYEIHKEKTATSVGKEPKGPRLVLLRLQPIDQEGYSCGKHFTVKYHDMNGWSRMVTIGGVASLGRVP